jgi:hypothetical protein
MQSMMPKTKVRVLPKSIKRRKFLSIFFVVIEAVSHATEKGKQKTGIA